MGRSLFGVTPWVNRAGSANKSPKESEVSAGRLPSKAARENKNVAGNWSRRMKSVENETISEGNNILLLQEKQA